MALTLGQRVALRAQRVLSYFSLIVFGPVLVALYHLRVRYSAQDLRAIRSRYRELRAAHPGPLLICSNHLTLIDSIVQAIVLESLWGYLRHPSALPWNLPEARNFKHDWSWRVV